MKPGLLVSDRHFFPLVSVVIYRTWWRYYDYRKFQIDTLGDHLYTCTSPIVSDTTDEKGSSDKNKTTTNRNLVLQGKEVM
jgi:hypothetical protein